MREVFTLSDAVALGHAVRVSCHICRGPRFYRPEDLLKLFGDIACSAVEEKMRCESCGRKDYLRVRIERLSGEQMAKARFRRLVGVKRLLRPVWRDD